MSADPTVEDALRWTGWLCERAEKGDDLTEHEPDMKRLLWDMLYSVINLSRNGGAPTAGVGGHTGVENIRVVHAFLADVFTTFLEEEAQA